MVPELHGHGIASREEGTLRGLQNLSLSCLWRGNWGVATGSWLFRESEQSSDLGLWFPHLLLIILPLQPKGDVNIQHWNIGCCWKCLHSDCVRISALMLLIFCLEMLLQLAISLGKMLLFSFTPDSGEKRRADYVIQLPFDQNHWHLCHFLVGRNITTAPVSIML